MLQLVQIVGAVLVLAGFGLTQIGVLDLRSYLYLALNLVGAGVLAALALHEQQWGFLLLEGAWATMALASLVSRVRDGRAP